MFPIASNSDNEKLYVDDVFSTWLYTGNGSTQTITNGIDFAGKGGLVWIKARTSPTGYSNILMDTARGFGRYLTSNDTIGQDGYGDLGWTTGSFNSNGFTTVNGSNATINGSSATFASWSFRKAAKFFDVVTYTGDGTNNRSIIHSLGQEVGMLITKSTSTTGDWNTYHRSATGGYLKLNSTGATITLPVVSANLANTSNTTASSIRNDGAGTWSLSMCFNVSPYSAPYYGMSFNTTSAGQYLQVDLGSATSVSIVQYQNGVGGNWAPTSVLVQYSSNGSTWTTIATYADDNTTNIQSITFTPTTARFWRLYQNSDTRYASLSAGYQWNIGNFNVSSTYTSNLILSATSSAIVVSGIANTSGVSYVAYVFAHDTSSTGIIQCGIYTGSGSTDTVTLGWEPQYVLMKNTNGTGQWSVEDIQRGMSFAGQEQLQPNSTTAAVAQPSYIIPTATGFTVAPNYYGTGAPVIYMAIRRPNKPPTSASQVYSYAAGQNTSAKGQTVFNAGFPIDMFIEAWRNIGGRYIYDRLRDRYQLETSSSAAESGPTGYRAFDNNTSIIADTQYYPFATNNIGAWCFKRAPGFFDIVCYTGDAAATRTISHNLGVLPEFIIVKSRNGSNLWFVYHSGYWTSIQPYALALNENLGNSTYGGFPTAPSSTGFIVGGPNTNSGNSGYWYQVAYLFATLSGISKVGSYIGNGSSQNIDCGFGSRYSVFVLIKRTDSTGDWYVWDTARGITASIDPHLLLNTATAEVSTTNSIDLVSSGFTVIQNSTTNINVTNATYIYLSIASSVSYLTGGEALFTTPGTFYWTCPAGVTEACVVCIGGGGGLGGTYGSGNSGSGAGGALTYLNNYAVTPGTVYTVVVGGAASSSSCFGITAGGGLYYNNRLASSGGTSFNGGDSDGGGGGAGGYTGQGGYGGGQLNSAQAPRNGQGLGAGGGGSGGSANTGTSNAGGGGASLYGGAGGNGGVGGYNTAGTGGAAASTTTNNGESGKSGVEYGGGNGGKYGGGGGSLNISGGGYVAGIGASGAVRIMWGSGRSFPYSAG